MNNFPALKIYLKREKGADQMQKFFWSHLRRIISALSFSISLVILMEGNNVSLADQTN